MPSTAGAGGSGHPSGGRRGPEDRSAPGRNQFGHGGAAVRVLPQGKGRTVAVIGVGYVGLPTAATLAHLGHRVTCGDADPAKVAMLQRGQVPIVEDHLEELVREGQEAGRLRFVVGASSAVEGAEFVFLCVPTPQGDDGSADLSYRRGGGRGDRAAPPARNGHRQQVDRTGGLDPGGRAGPRPIAT